MPWFEPIKSALLPILQIGYHFLIVATVLCVTALIVAVNSRRFAKLSDAFFKLTHFQRVVAIMCIVIATVYAQKDDGDDGAGAPRMMMAPMVTPTASDIEDLASPTNSALAISGIEVGTNSVALGISWTDALSPTNNCLDLFASWDLLSGKWSHLAEIDLGTASSNIVAEIDFSLYPTNVLEHTAFFRIATQADSDGDGLTDAFEHLVSLSLSTSSDSDSDGVSDGDEILLGINPNEVDSDGDGLVDGDEVGSVEVMPLEDAYWQHVTSVHHLWTSRTGIDSGSYVVNLPHPYTVNGVTYSQVRVCVDGIFYLLDPSNSNSWCATTFLSPPSLANDPLCQHHIAIAAYCADLYIGPNIWGSDVSYGSSILPSGPANVFEFFNIGFSAEKDEGNYHLVSYQLVLPSGEPNVFYLTYLSPYYDFAYYLENRPTIGVQCPQLYPIHNEDWHYNLTWDRTAEMYYYTKRIKFTIGRGTDPGSRDSDRDGFSDYDEAVLFQTDPNRRDFDADSDGLPDAAEARLGTNSALADTDYDGLTDLEELVIGTNPSQPDTDGDGMNDGWEAAHNGGGTATFDPLVNNSTDLDPNNDCTADPDGDGLTNAEECEWNTDPFVTDSDGDGTDDGDEVSQSSDPNDASDSGIAHSRVSMSFYFGDHSISHSEKYCLRIIPVTGSGAGTVPRTLSYVNANYGECETKVVSLVPGWKYTVVLTHAGTNLNSVPDYDYTLLITGDVPNNVEIDDSDSLFGIDDTSQSFAAELKSATITVYDVKVSVCKPEDNNWEELEVERVLLDDENFRAKIRITPAIDTLAHCRQLLGNSIVVKTSGTKPEGANITIDSLASFTSTSDYSEIRIEKTWAQLRALGILPTNDEDGVDEMAWIDMASGPGQNLADSEAFAGLAYADRGTASTLDPSRTLDSTPPNSVPSESYFMAAGREIVTVTYDGVVSDKRQIMNQADVFYFSGHGDHNGNVLQGEFTPVMVQERWNRDLDVVIIAGCSVLDINDYNGNYSGMSHSISPGIAWEDVGPSILLGYAYSAPGDAGGAPTRIINQWRANRATSGDVDAWMDANATNKAWNACAIVKGNRYLYFKKRRWGRRSIISVNKGDW